jgi:hypothetical protein
MKNQELQRIAIKWIAAKATNLDSDEIVRAAAWADFELAITKFQKKHKLADSVLAALLKETAADIYANELKSEVFGYSEVSA